MTCSSESFFSPNAGSKEFIGNTRLYYSATGGHRFVTGFTKHLASRRTGFIAEMGMAEASYQSSPIAQTLIM
jgi:hypothetical protein